MKNAKNILIILTAMVLSISFVSAKSLTSSTHETNSTEGLSINIIQQNQETISGRLINADETYLVFENTYDASIQVIPREDVKVLETNLNVNLINILKSHSPESLTDVIELNDGTKIPSIVLDITPEGIQYFTGKSLRRQLVSSSSVYALHLDSDSVEIPFPMISAYEPAL